MRLILEGKINKTYLQSLCMMFFHGEKFPEIEVNPRGTVFVRTTEQNGGILAECEFIYLDKAAKASAFCENEDGDTSERTSKCAVGKAVYQAGKELTGKDIPWGILTGIRPSKIGAEQKTEDTQFQKACSFVIFPSLVIIASEPCQIVLAKS